MSAYIIALKHKDKLEAFTNVDKFFKDLDEAYEYVSFFEKQYPNNKGKYMIFEVNMVGEQ